jgi:hypothetical protein
MSGAIHPLPQYTFMAWYLVKKHRDNFTFYFLPMLNGNVNEEGKCSDLSDIRY